MSMQLDLFAGLVIPVPASVGRGRPCPASGQLRDALVCLRDSVPTALEVVVDLDYPAAARDTRAPSRGVDWAYCVCRAGLRFESVYDWGPGARARGERDGFDRTPARLATWDELRTVLADDPRRGEVADWARSLPEPRWQILQRPHELWPPVDSWHVGYLCRDHVDAHWTARRRAWQLVLDLLGDAITRLDSA